MAQTITVFDFDKTIYDGDSTIEFYLYCLRRRLSLIRYLPGQLWHGLLFAVRIEKKTAFKSHFFSFVKGIDDLEQFVEGFWTIHETKIGQWYRDRDHSRDVIISASPEFLVAPIMRKLGASTTIATKVNQYSGLIEGENCHGVEKVERLFKIFPNPVVDEVYSDSLTDMPIFNLASQKLLVRRHKIMPLEDYQKLPFAKRFFS